ncbi:MAG: hypothetical protein ACI8TQ_002253 [Planctomycetota bacterium]|jgi:hypothetical protein
MIDQMVPTKTAKPSKRPLRFLAAAVSLVFFASCHTTDPSYNHWNMTGLAPRMAYHFLSYDTNKGIPYYEHAMEQRNSINMTLRRHLLNDNPENPFQRKNVWLPNRQRFSPLPNPVNFFHLSSVAFGSALLGAGGGFILFPFEIIPVMLEDGGPSEMWAGIKETFTGETALERGPAPVSEFKVKNR